MRKISAIRVTSTSFFVDLGDIILNLFVAVLSGSAVMFVEAMQGTADLLTSGLLWVGVKRSQRLSDKQHPFGYGREIYFWTLIASLSMLTITATFSIYHGWQHLINPQPLDYTPLALVALLIAVVTNSYACSLSYQRLRGDQRGQNMWAMFSRSMLVETKATFILDLMGTVSALVGYIALLLFQVTGNTQFDGLGAMAIGIGIAFFAVLLVADVKDLLIGRSVSPEIERDIENTALTITGVEGVLDLRTMSLGSNKLLVNMELDIADDLKTQQIERLMDAIKAEIKTKIPSVGHIQLEVETPRRSLIEKE